MFFIKWLGLRSKVLTIGVFRGHHRNESHHINLGVFKMTKRNVVAIIRAFMYLPWKSE